MVPAVGQGCVAVEARADDAATLLALAPIDHSLTRQSVEAERAFLAELGSGCSLPVGAHVVDGWLHAFLADERLRSVSTSVRLGHDWTATAADTARSMLAEISR
jgi:hydroxymethylbilane synthase